jgi:hypothetical protein
MTARQSLLAAVALAILSSPLLAGGGVGSQLPPVELEGYTNTKATSFDDLLGRTVLIEFFAYW